MLRLERQAWKYEIGGGVTILTFLTANGDDLD
jgi:hypothetical protein